MRYLVSVAGGIGPNVWDNEFDVEAETIREALDKAEAKLYDSDGAIIAIEQCD